MSKPRKHKIVTDSLSRIERAQKNASNRSPKRYHRLMASLAHSELQAIPVKA